MNIRADWIRVGQVLTALAMLAAPTGQATDSIAANSDSAMADALVTSLDIGNSLPAGGAVSVTGGLNVRGGGTRIGGTSDQFQFSYLTRTGNFDVTARLASLTLTDPWAEAGFMARESLAAGSRFAGVLGTPSISGCYFESRATLNNDTSRTGSYPVNYPNQWLRLQRVGNQFTGYASRDGQRWTQLGSVNLALPATVYFGYAVSSRNTNQTAVAAFRDQADVTNALASAGAIEREPLAQCSRRTPLVISEIMYRPPKILRGTNEARLEFIEIFNSRGEPEDLSGFRLSGDVDYAFPINTVIPGGGFLVVARSPADIQAVYGLEGVLGPWVGATTNGLPNNGGTIHLRHRTGAVLLSVPYSNQPPWPLAADGAGHSLMLARPSYGEGNPRAWAASDSVLGSPGRLDPVSADPLAGVMINEILAHTDPPLADYLELYNHSNEAKDLSGAWLSDSPTTNKFRIPDGVVLPARGFACFTETALGFGLSAGGQRVYLVNSNRTRVIDALEFGPQESGVAYGRVPDGADTFYRLTARTPGTNNSVALVSPVVINEIMYHPISEDDDDQYVELYNRSGATIELAGWRLEDGVSFSFPSNTVLAANGYLVVARNAAHLRPHYVNLTAVNCLGDFSGKLSKRGERLALSKPDSVISTNATGKVETNTIHLVVNEVTYGSGGRWGQWSDGGGSSLELVDPNSDNRLAPNWADSDESAKAPWTLIERRGLLDNGDVAADQLQLLLQGAGECLIDNVEVLDATSANLVANSTFEANATGWTAQGTESLSAWEAAEGFNSLHSYHVRAVDRGDNQVNRIRTPLSATLASGATATLRARVRWLKGHPEILLRLRGKWLEVAGRMDLPANLGTPGAPNSRTVKNGPPAIYQVAHQPVLPGAGEAVVVSARISDPDGVSTPVLRYRVDPAASYVSVLLRDDGTGGDGVAGDGVYSATVPGQPTGALVAFYIEVTDRATSAATSRFPPDAPARECLVRFGENVPTGNLPVYRIWMTQATFNAWAGRLKLDNTPNDVTFVLDGRRVIYNTQALFAGSPYIAPGFSTPSGNRCGYSISFPADDLFLDNLDLVLDWPGGHGNENTGIQEQMAYWIADHMNLPFSYRYTIRLQVNGVTDMQRGGVFEAVMQPAGDYLDEWSFGDTGGDFYKIDRGFEFSDAGSLTADPMPRLQAFSTTDLADGAKIKKTERYRWTWQKRSYGSANNYTNIYALVDALNAVSPEPYTAATEMMVDVEEWMGIFAFEHIINNFDSWGHVIGKNMYSYKPQHGRWQLYPFDLDWLMLVSPRYSAEYTATSGPLFNSDDPTITRMYNFAPFRRAYFRAVQAAVDGPLSSAQCNPVMDAKYASLVANGVTMCDGSALVNPAAVKTWFQQRHDALQAQLASVAANFTVIGATNLTVSSNLVTLTGTAPITLETLTVNGVAWPVTWTSVNGWSVQVPVPPGTNQLLVAGYDQNGNPIAGASQPVTVIYGGQTPSPREAIVINEIMFNPKVPGAGFIELFNTSSNAAFDLSGWNFNGLGYTFPPGSFLNPGWYLVLAKDPVAFDVAYGAGVAPFDLYPGNLQSDGETLTLTKPGANAAGDLVVAKVRYEGGLPWPAGANATGSSLQLIDPLQDNWRAGNWGLVQSNAAPIPQWVYVTATGTASSSVLYVYLQSVGDLYLDDLNLVAGSVPEVGQNFIVNGDFESAFPGAAWTVSANHSGSGLSTTIKHGGDASLHVVASTGGSTKGSSIWQTNSPALTNGATYTLSFWYRQSSNGGPLTVRLSGSGIDASVDPAPPANLASVTPGAVNAIAASLPAFPSLWINELEADNLTGITNGAGQRVPWVELYNPSAQSISLNGLYLANQYTNLTAWAFPPDAIVDPGQFLVVFADGQTNLSTAQELHTGFTLVSRAGSVALSRLYQGQPQVLDYIHYTNLVADGSYGSFPNGQSFARQQFFQVTPGSANAGAGAPLTVFINEWMADNTVTYADPADNHFDDWFEIYNPGDAVADLGGYYLTDNLTNQFQFQIPANGHYQIPPHGFLLVWADNEPGQNETNRADLHVNFRLDKTGDAIGLFAADGTAMDTVTFGPQTNDVSQGRVPDGAALIAQLAAASPGTNNMTFNTAPMIVSPGNQAVYLGQSLSFVVQANDGDNPAQTLEYRLESGAPANAAIDPATGLFTWTPTPAQSPGTNLITVRVTDNGVPALSARGTFTVMALLPPDLIVGDRNGGMLSLSWPGVTSKTYQVEYAESLGSPNWINLGPSQPGTGGLLSFKIDLANDGQRFYRIVVVE